MQPHFSSGFRSPIFARLNLTVRINLASLIFVSVWASPNNNNNNNKNRVQKCVYIYMRTFKRENLQAIRLHVTLALMRLRVEFVGLLRTTTNCSILCVGTLI